MKKIKKIMAITIATIATCSVVASASSEKVLGTYTNSKQGNLMNCYCSYTSYSTHRAALKNFNTYASKPVYVVSGWVTPGNTASVSCQSTYKYVQKVGIDM